MRFMTIMTEIIIESLFIQDIKKHNMKNIFLLFILCYFNNSYGQYYDPDSTRKLEEGKRKYKEIDFYGAIESYNELIKDSYGNSGVYEVYFLRGEAKTKLKDYAGAIKDYTTSLYKYKYTNMGHVPQAYYNRGFAKDRLGDYEGAAKDYIEAINNFPFVESEGDTKGTGNYSSQTYSIAIKLLSNKIVSDPTNKVLYHNRGIANLESGNVVDACNDFHKAIELGFSGAGAFTDRYCR